MKQLCLEKDQQVMYTLVLKELILTTESLLKLSTLEQLTTKSLDICSAVRLQLWAIWENFKTLGMKIL